MKVGDTVELVNEHKEYMSCCGDRVVISRGREGTIKNNIQFIGRFVVTVDTFHEYTKSDKCHTPKTLIDMCLSEEEIRYKK